MGPKTSRKHSKATSRHALNTKAVLKVEELVLFVTYTIIQSITSSEMCSLHLTHPSAQTPGAAGQCCGTR